MKTKFNILLIVIVFLSIKTTAQPSANSTQQVIPQIISIGNFTSRRANCDSLKIYHKIIATSGYTVRSYTVYFSGANFPTAVVASVNGDGMQTLDSFFMRCLPGTVITFDKVKLKDTEGKEISIAGKQIVLY